MDKWTRRRFFLATLTGGIAAGTRRLFGATDATREATTISEDFADPAASQGVRPLIISSANGLQHLDDGMALLQSGGDTLDAALAVVTKVEDDPNDDSVGYGGLPNEEGVVELDACVMHGPTRRAGSVAAIRGIKTPSRIAKLVMTETDHIMLAGAGALRFAKSYGYSEENLLTEKSRLA